MSILGCIVFGIFSLWLNFDEVMECLVFELKVYFDEIGINDCDLLFIVDENGFVMNDDVDILGGLYLSSLLEVGKYGSGNG